MIESIAMEGRTVAGPARLICMLEGGAAFTSNIKKVTVEQRGPVRATLELAAGTTAKLNILVGDKVEQRIFGNAH